MRALAGRRKLREQRLRHGLSDVSAATRHCHQVCRPITPHLRCVNSCFCGRNPSSDAKHVVKDAMQCCSGGCKVRLAAAAFGPLGRHLQASWMYDAHAFWMIRSSRVLWPRMAASIRIDALTSSAEGAGAMNAGAAATPVEAAIAASGPVEPPNRAVILPARKLRWSSLATGEPPPPRRSGGAPSQTKFAMGSNICSYYYKKFSRCR